VAKAGEDLHTRHKEQTLQWQLKLKNSTDALRLELGLEAVRAQRTSEALDAMAREIKSRKRDMPWGA
jgi:hypothetical protein